MISAAAQLCYPAIDTLSITGTFAQDKNPELPGLLYNNTDVFKQQAKFHADLKLARSKRMLLCLM